MNLRTAYPCLAAHCLAESPWRNVRAAIGIAVGGAALPCGGCTSVQTQAEQERDFYYPMAPIPVLVHKGQELKAAERAAGSKAGDIAVRGDGCSMEPIYANGTGLVVSPIRYGQLRRGMAIVYCTRQGLYVAHLLVHKVAEGWVAGGANNVAVDSEFVTPENLVGVITQAYTSVESPLLGEWLAFHDVKDELGRLRIARLP